MKDVPNFTQHPDFLYIIADFQSGKTPISFLSQLKCFNMDEETNRKLTRQLGLFSATLLLVHFDSTGLPETKILKEAWTLYNDEEVFKSMMIKELSSLLLKHHD